MTDRQRKVLGEAFLLLMAGARRGRAIAGSGTLREARAHVAEMEAMLAEMKRAMDLSAGAAAVLEKAGAS